MSTPHIELSATEGKPFLDSFVQTNMFNNQESDYLKSQFLMRVATASRSGRPNVVPVGYEFDGKYFYTGSIKREILRASPRNLNIKSGNKRVALVIDDLVSVDPWKPRGIRVNGVADLVTRDGEFGKTEYIRIKPRLSWSWGLAESRTKTIWK